MNNNTMAPEKFYTLVPNNAKNVEFTTQREKDLNYLRNRMADAEEKIAERPADHLVLRYWELQVIWAAHLSPAQLPAMINSLYWELYHQNETANLLASWYGLW